MNFNTILGEIYDMNLDEILSDCRGESYLSIKKNASKTEGYISVSRHFTFVYFCAYNPYFCSPHTGTPQGSMGEKEWCVGML